jgi:DNA-directed RNA polymerase specialized sigma24 family protein
MGKGQHVSALRLLWALFADGTATGLSDSQLLEQYKSRRAESADAAVAAETAFAALVDRHGAMVWGVCRRVLGDAHEAEDAFQATFLVLVRKAGSVRVDGSLGRWLYGVAHKVAHRARSDAERRASGIARISPASPEDPVGAAELSDLRRAVGEELDRLPAK